MQMTITKSQAEERVDKVLGQLLPEASLRHRRRLIESGGVTLDQRPVRPGIRVRCGQVLAVSLPETTGIPEGVAVLHREGAYAAVTKPAGVHSAMVAGGGGATVEGALEQLFAGERPRLLNRLDQDTSGFVLVAFTEDAAQRFRALEASGRVRKEYLALVEGHLEGPKVVRNRLDMAERAVVKVLDAHDPDPARHTHVEPLKQLEGSTLVRAVIARGARHQIRAHLAHLGHSISGDAVYGSRAGHRLRLHHRALDFDGFSAVLEPDWGRTGAGLGSQGR